MSEELEGYVTVPEAAQQMGRSTEQVRRYLREGKLEGRRIGGQWFIREQAVLYRTRGPEERAMNTEGPEAPRGPYTRAVLDRLGVFARVNRRREEVRRRWEKMGVRVDAAELVSEVREEEP